MNFSLRLKIILTFLLVGTIVSGLLSFSVYRILDAGLLRQMQGRVQDLAKLGAQLVDADALAHLKLRLGEDLSDQDVARVESSKDFLAVSNALNQVRGVESRLVHFIYTFSSTPDPKKALYLVDGDVLPDREAQAAGKAASQDVSHFSSAFDVTDFPVARKAMAEKASLVEEAWTYDPDFKVNSITGYAPVFTRNGAFVGMLGVDMVDTDVHAILSNATTVTLAVIAAALALTVASSIFLGTVFTRGIVTLDRVVRSFDKDLSIRVPVRSRDEVGRLSLSFNDMAETIQDHNAAQEALTNAYGRFVPKELLQLLDRESILDVKLGDQVQKEMTVLFSDIRSFTRMSETMTPFENFNFLNSYLRRMGPEIRNNHGVIDKYIGDAIMALFPTQPADALAAAVGMHKKLTEYNAHRATSGYAPISIGVGVNMGKVMLGTVGEHERMDGSVIADTVNLCSRLETLTRYYGSGILTTGRTLKALATPGSFPCRFIDRVRVRGRKEAVLVFEVLDGESEAQKERRLSYREQFAHAQRAYFSRRFDEALGVIGPLQRGNPEDHVLDIYRARCEKLVREGAPETWEGVEEIDLR